MVEYIFYQDIYGQIHELEYVTVEEYEKLKQELADVKAKVLAIIDKPFSIDLKPPYDDASATREVGEHAIRIVQEVRAMLEGKDNKEPAAPSCTCHPLTRRGETTGSLAESRVVSAVDADCAIHGKHAAPNTPRDSPMDTSGRPENEKAGFGFNSRRGDGKAAEPVKRDFCAGCSKQALHDAAGGRVKRCKDCPRERDA